MRKVDKQQREEADRKKIFKAADELREQFELDETQYKHALIMLAGIVGSHSDIRIARITGLSRGFVIRRKKRLIEQGIWDRNGRIPASWNDPENGNVAFFLDLLVLDGLVDKVDMDNVDKTKMDDRERERGQKSRKAVRKDQNIHIRVTEEQKAELVAAATSAGLCVGPWILHITLREAKRQLSPTSQPAPAREISRYRTATKLTLRELITRVLSDSGSPRGSGAIAEDAQQICTYVKVDSVYAEVKRMKNEGLVVEMGRTSSGYPAYTLTDDGNREHNRP